MSKAAVTHTYAEALRHFGSLSHADAMRELAALGVKVTAIASAANASPELTEAQYVELGKLSEEIETLLSTLDHELQRTAYCLPPHRL
jgi:hypothetical protein